MPHFSPGPLSLAATALGLAACGSAEPSSLDAVVEHACLHAGQGPFRDVAASTDLVATVSDVSRVHTAFHIGLPPDAQGYQGAVVFEPVNDGLHAFMTDAAVTVAIRGRDGSQVPLVDDTAAVGCPALAHVATAELDVDRRYAIAFGPTPQARLLLVIENADDLAE